MHSASALWNSAFSRQWTRQCSVHSGGVSRFYPIPSQTQFEKIKSEKSEVPAGVGSSTQGCRAKTVTADARD